MTEQEYNEIIETIAEHNATGDIEEIVELITSLSKEDLTDELLGELGRAYNNVAEFQNAYDTLIRIQESQKGNLKWHYRLAYALFYLRRFDEAIENFKAIVGSDEYDEELMNWINRCELEIKILQERKERRKNYIPNETPFAKFDFSDFWDDCDFSIEDYISEYPTDEIIMRAEKELGYKLPKSYIELCKKHNGGYLTKTCCPCNVPTSWSDDHVGVTGILGIGFEKRNSIGGEFGSRFMIEEWKYPNIGVAIADCPSAGHDMIFLDYSLCGSQGEPEVVHIDQENGYQITWLANDFEEFIGKLVGEEMYDTSDDDKKTDLEKVRTAEFSETLLSMIENTKVDFDIGAQIRKISEAIVEEKGHFSLHDDALSNLLYDVQFWLYSNENPKVIREHYFTDYPEIIALADGFSTGGYADSFLKNWLDTSIQNGDILELGSFFYLEENKKKEIIKNLRDFK